jgi:hypothetical protein
MVEILKFDDTLRRRGPSAPPKSSRKDQFSYWPEVSSGLWVAGSQPVDPANSQERVLFEILLILGVTAAVVAVISFLVSAPLAM